MSCLFTTVKTLAKFLFRVFALSFRHFPITFFQNSPLIQKYFLYFDFKSVRCYLLYSLLCFLRICQFIVDLVSCCFIFAICVEVSTILTSTKFSSFLIARTHCLSTYAFLCFPKFALIFGILFSCNW